MAHVVHGFGNVFALHDADALLKDYLALVVHHVVEFQEVFADVEVSGFDFLLGLFKRLVDPGMDNGFAFLETKLLQHGIHALGTEDSHQVVFKGEIEPGASGIALAAGTAAELIVDAAAFMAFCADDEEAPGGDDLLLVGLDFGCDGGDALVALCPFRNIGQFRCNAHVQIATELNVSAAASHVGGDRNATGDASLRNDRRFLFMVARIQDIVRHAH